MQKRSSHNAGKKFLILFIVILTGGWILLGPYGALKYYNINRQLREAQAQNQQLREENEALQKEINSLTNDPKYLEEIARKKYGLVKKNEIIFEFEEKKKRH